MLLEVKAKVKRIIDGKTRNQTDTYLIEEELFAKAEYAVYAVLASQQREGTVESFEVISIRQSPIREIDEQTLNNHSYSFIATLIDYFTDDDGNEKKMKYKIILWADSLTEANHRALEFSHQGYNMLVEEIKQVNYLYITSPNESQQS